MSTTDPALAQQVISLIDLTDLSDDHGAGGIESLLESAVRHGTAAVCLWPEFVETAAQRLAGTSVRLATVANFPSGDADVGTVLDDVARSLAAGAHEIDVVLPYRAALDGDLGRGRNMLEAVAEIVHERSAHLKVILETGELGDRQLIVDAGEMAVAAGADFLKTSTGKTSQGASLDALDAMIDVVVGSDRIIGLKPSGGISTVAAASEYLDLVERRLGVEATSPERFRFGASSLLGDALEQLADGNDGN